MMDNILIEVYHMKRTILFIMIIVILSCLIGCSLKDSERITVQNYIYHDTQENITICNFGEGEVFLQSCGVDNGDLVLPTEFYGGITINMVGESAFSENESIVSLTVPDGYTYIDYFAFMNCKNLKTIYFGKDVSEIAGSAFIGSVNIESFSVSKDNPYIYESEGCILSREDDTLLCTNGKLPKETKKIGELQFSNRNDITDITIHDGLIHIGFGAFSDSSLESVELPQGLLEIGENAFANTQIKEIYIPESVKTIGKCAFSGNEGLIINCQSESKPDGWNEQWLEGCDNYTLIWGNKTDA